MERNFSSRALMLGKTALVGATMAGFCSSPVRLVCARMMIASAASRRPTTDSTKPSSTTVGEANRLSTLATSYTKPASAAIRHRIAGGMKTNTVGVRTVTGMITIMTATTGNILLANKL